MGDAAACGAEPAPRCVGPWRLGAQIGAGSFAVVHRAVSAADGTPAAVKEIDTKRLSPKLIDSLASEVNVLRAASSHAHIVKLLDTVQAPGRLFLVLEFCAGGDLAAWLGARPSRRAGEAPAAHFLRHLARGLAELRRLHVVHRDLKPHNLLLVPAPERDGRERERDPATGAPLPTLKIADFGFATRLPGAELAETLCGSPLYMAPEVLACRRYDAKADLWSVGTILWEMLVGAPPYGGANHVALLRSIEAAPPTLPPALKAELSARCVALLTALLTRDPVARISFPEFFTHPFLAPPEQGAAAQTPHQGATSPPRAAPPRAASPDDTPPPFALGACSDSDEDGPCGDDAASREPPQSASLPPRPSPLAAAAAAHAPLPPPPPLQRRASAGARAAAAAAVSAAELTLQPVDAAAMPLGLPGSAAEDDSEYVLVDSPSASRSSAAAALYGARPPAAPPPGGLSRRLSGAAAALLSAAASAAGGGSSPPPGSPGFARPPRQPPSPSGGGASPPAMPWSRAAAAAASPSPPETPPPLPPPPLAVSASGASPPAVSPPLPPAARVGALQRCAGILDALAAERAAAGAPTEALALYLLALACVRGAAASALAAGAGAAALGARLARAGDAILTRALATGAAASAAAAPKPPPPPAARSPGGASPGSPAGGALPPRPPPAVPDGWELAHAAAMALGRQGGADELLGRPAAAVSCYGRALSLLGLILREGAALPPSPACPPLALAPQQRQRLGRAAAALRARAAAAALAAGMGALPADESWPAS